MDMRVDRTVELIWSKRGGGEGWSEGRRGEEGREEVPARVEATKAGEEITSMESGAKGGVSRCSVCGFEWDDGSLVSHVAQMAMPLPVSQLREWRSSLSNTMTNICRTTSSTTTYLHTNATQDHANANANPTHMRPGTEGSAQSAHTDSNVNERREEYGGGSGEGDEVGVSGAAGRAAHKCAHCGQEFVSRNRLFAHLGEVCDVEARGGWSKGRVTRVVLLLGYIGLRFHGCSFNSEREETKRPTVAGTLLAAARRAWLGPGGEKGRGEEVGGARREAGVGEVRGLGDEEEIKAEGEERIDEEEEGRCEEGMGMDEEGRRPEAARRYGQEAVAEASGAGLSICFISRTERGVSACECWAVMSIEGSAALDESALRMQLQGESDLLRALSDLLRCSFVAQLPSPLIPPFFPPSSPSSLPPCILPPLAADFPVPSLSLPSQSLLVSSTHYRFLPSSSIIPLPPLVSLQARGSICSALHAACLRAPSSTHATWCAGKSSTTRCHTASCSLLPSCKPSPPPRPPPPPASGSLACLRRRRVLSLKSCLHRWRHPWEGWRVGTWSGQSAAGTPASHSPLVWNERQCRLSMAACGRWREGRGGC